MVVGCTHFLTPLPPWKKWILDGPPGDLNKYPVLYNDGWKDGCKTGLYTNAPIFYKQNITDGFTQDAIKAQNKLYYKGWRDGFDYCQRYVWQYRRRPFF
jgi:hypothetical protein